jgi:hypothetical protein
MTDIPKDHPKYDAAYNHEFFKPGYILKAATYAALIADMLSDKTHGSLAVDVGTGNGLVPFLLTEMGYFACGHEYNKEWSKEISDRYRIVCSYGPWEHHHGDYKAEVLSCLHVLEHSMDPGAFLDSCRRNTKLGGLVLIEMPDPECDMFVSMQWHHLRTRHPAEHVFLPSLGALADLAQKKGLIMVDKQRQPRYSSFLATFKCV